MLILLGFWDFNTPIPNMQINATIFLKCLNSIT